MLARAITAAIDGVSPGVLFQNNEPGVWFDPQDLKTLYQDSAGTIPVTGVEQPVGLMLDKSKGLVLGPELVTNGGFSNGTTGWSNANAASSASVTSGELITSVSTAGGSTAGGQVYQLTLVVGKSYTLTGSVRRISGDYAHLSVVNNAMSAFVAQGTQITSAASVSASLTFVATETNNKVYLRSYSAASTGSGGGFDNISVRELPGYHATQSTAGSRPTLSARYNMLVGTDTYTGGTATTLAANYTLSFSGTGTITLSGTATGICSAGTSIFSATAGTLTLTASGQVTNAQLVATEKSHPQGLTYGPELVTNGGFDTDTWWSKSAGWGISGGTANASSAANGGGVYRRGLLTAGKSYTVTFTVTSLTTGSVRIYSGGATSATYSSAGTYTAIIVNGPTDDYFTIEGRFTPVTLSVDNISVREITNVSDNRFPYQSVTSATVYDSDQTKFPWFLRCTDHWMVTPSIDASAFNKVAVFAALRKMSDASIAVPLRFFTTSHTDSGSITVFLPSQAGVSQVEVVSPTTNNGYARALIDSAPFSFAFCAQVDLSKSTNSEGRCKVSVNGVDKTFSAGSASSGTGPLGSHVVWVGKSTSASYPFNGFIYGLAVRFASSLPNDNLISAISKSFAAKAGIKI